VLSQMFPEYISDSLILHHTHTEQRGIRAAVCCRMFFMYPFVTVTDSLVKINKYFSNGNLHLCSFFMWISPDRASHGKIHGQPLPHFCHPLVASTGAWLHALPPLPVHSSKERDERVLRER